ncbi:ribonuclease P [Candidatus Woesearchaeota archaeon CG10_big_fil_rev_8_21_14_0_10_32_24]|nr:MAG: ribonuclease P [Candidatus Woesearchaeota archaeon CG10_big_fil_rev_8_21_14_0_10_32_24]
MVKATYPHELIGEEIVVVDATNPSLNGVKGKVVDETKHTIMVDVQGTIKTLMKNAISFTIKGKDLRIEGKDLIKRPEERVKG